MTIAAIRTRVVRAPYRRPFGISSGTSEELISVVVEVEDADGVVGTGEASPMTAYTGETPAGIRAAIDDHLGPAVIGLDPMDLAGAHLAMDRVLRGQRVAKAAVDIALHDLAARMIDRPVCLLIGGRVRDPVATTWVVGLGTIDEMAAEAQDHAAMGFRHIKVKGGHDVRRDLDMVGAVRAAMPEDTELSLDANEGYDAADLPVLRRMADAGLSLLEQPLPHWDLAGLVRLRDRLDLRIMADESVRSPHDAVEIIRRGAADVINIKILKVGGLYRAVQVAAIAEAAGLAVKIGSMPELGVATLAAVHLAAALPGATVPADLVGPLMVADEPLAPAAFADVKNGLVPVPAGPGLGPILEGTR